MGAKGAGRKDDAGKPDPTLMPPLAEWLLIEVLHFGATKPGYGPENWRKVENAKQRYLAAAMRHINKYRRGQQTDEESGLHHLAHAAISLIFVLQLELEKQSEK